MVFMKREALSSMYYPPLIDPASVVHAKLQVPSFSSVFEPSDPATISNIIISLPPPP
jgi:hypothetical protein